MPTVRLVWQAAPEWATAQILLLMLQGLLPLFSLYFTKRIIDLVTANRTNTGEIAWQPIVGLLLLTAIVAIGNTSCNALAELVNTAQAQQVTDRMSHILHTKSIEVDLDYYENSTYYDTLQRAQTEAMYRPSQLLSNLIQIAQNSVALVAMVGLLLALHWSLATILFVAAIPAVLVRIRFATITYQWLRRRTAVERQTEYLNWLLTGNSFAKEIRLFQVGQFFSQQFDRLRQQLYREMLAIQTKRTIASLAAQVLGTLFTFSAYAFVVYQTVQGRLQIGDLYLYHAALQRGQESLKGILASLSALYEDNLFLANLYEFLALSPQIVEPDSPQPVPQPMQTGIVFNQVSFHYPNTTRQALKQIDLQLGPGEVIALVGENGSGKTTLIKLLCRLYDPTSGQITIDGVDLRQFSLADLRRQFSVIFQDYVQYHFTAHDNIWLGNIAVAANDDRIQQAAQRSGADAVIRSLPQGYTTILGKLFEDGEELSIGQWQKIALARAFLRQSQVMILDEPTSAMDAKAEDEVFQGFRQLIQGQSAILISHRLSTVRMADRIYVLEQGKIVEQGTHDELMQRSGTYATLFETQAQHYR
jgi:ATP-binding cassette subfamily B protein